MHSIPSYNQKSVQNLITTDNSDEYQHDNKNVADNNLLNSLGYKLDQDFIHNNIADAKTVGAEYSGALAQMEELAKSEGNKKLVASSKKDISNLEQFLECISGSSVAPDMAFGSAKVIDPGVTDKTASSLVGSMSVQNAHANDIYKGSSDKIEAEVILAKTDAAEENTLIPQWRVRPRVHTRTTICCLNCKKLPVPGRTPRVTRASEKW
jgi:hypothetical protein